jgi:hypothetical protein
VYELDDGRVPPAGLSIKCPKCKSGFIVHRPEDGSKMARTLPAKVPLPGTAKPKEGAPAAPRKTQPAAPAQSQKTSTGYVVPLPGTPPTPPAAAARPKPAAVIPLPGTQPAARPVSVAKRPATQSAIQKQQAAIVPPRPEGIPTEQLEHAIPLPGLDAPVAAHPTPSRREVPAIELPEMPAFEPPPERRSQTPKGGAVALPGARNDETPAPAPVVQRSQTPEPAAHGEQVPLPGGEKETSAPILWSNTPTPSAQYAEARPVPGAPQESALPLPGLRIDGPVASHPARATPARAPRVPTPAQNDLLPDLDLDPDDRAPAAPAAIDLPPTPRRPTPRASFKLPDEDTALTPKVASDDDDTALTPKVGEDDTALVPKAGLDPLDFASPQHGHIPDAAGLDFELARPTPAAASPASPRFRAPAQDSRLPTPQPDRLPDLPRWRPRRITTRWRSTSLRGPAGPACRRSSRPGLLRASVWPGSGRLRPRGSPRRRRSPS